MFVVERLASSLLPHLLLQCVHSNLNIIKTNSIYKVRTVQLILELVVVFHFESDLKYTRLFLWRIQIIAESLSFVVFLTGLFILNTKALSIYLNIQRDGQRGNHINMEYEL